MGSCWITQVSLKVTTVIGASSETPSGHAYLNGGGGLHVGMVLPVPLGHSTLIAAIQPSLVLYTCHEDTCGGAGGAGGGGFSGCVGAGTLCGGGGLSGCVGAGSGCGRGGFETITGVAAGCVCAGSVCAVWSGCGWRGGGLPLDTMHAGMAAMVMTKGLANDLRGVRAAMVGPYQKIWLKLVRRPSAVDIHFTERVERSADVNETGDDQGQLQIHARQAARNSADLSWYAGPVGSATERLAALIARCEDNLGEVARIRMSGDKLAIEVEGELGLRWRLAVLRAALDAPPDGDAVRELYGELVDRYRDDPKCLAIVKPIGDEIRRRETDGSLPSTMVVRSNRHRSPTR